MAAACCDEDIRSLFRFDSDQSAQVSLTVGKGSAHRKISNGHILQLALPIIAGIEDFVLGENFTLFRDTEGEAVNNQQSVEKDSALGHNRGGVGVVSSHSK